MTIAERIERLGEIQERIDLRLGPDESIQVERKTIHALARCGLLVDDVAHMTDRQLLAIPDIGPKSIAYLRAYVGASNA